MEEIFLTSKLQKLRQRVDVQARPFLLANLNQILAEKFSTFSRSFNKILLIGAISEEFYKLLGERFKGDIYVSDIAPQLLSYVPEEFRLSAAGEIPHIDERDFDLIYSYLDLHHINNVPEYLKFAYQKLAPDGMFMASFFGGTSLQELRKATMQADMHFGGVTNRVFPFIEIKIAGMLLQKTGFDLIAADSDNLQVIYPDLKYLYQDLKEIAETNILCKTHKALMSKERLQMIAQYYQENSPIMGEFPANFEFIHLSGVKNPA